MKDLGDLHYFLGIKVIHTPEGILISQRHYMLSMLFKFGMMECKSVSTPLDRNAKLRLDSRTACDPKRFRQIVRSLSYPIFMISQLMVQPTVQHLHYAHHILRYVNGTKDMGMLYRTGIAEQLVSYTDADWAGNAVDRRSKSRFVLSLGSAAIARSIKKQPTIEHEGRVSRSGCHDMRSHLAKTTIKGSTSGGVLPENDIL